MMCSFFLDKLLVITNKYTIASKIYILFVYCILRNVHELGYKKIYPAEID